MLLCCDVGNTNIVLGLFDGETLVTRWRLTTDRNRTADELRLSVRGLLDEAGVPADSIDGVAVASVVPSLNPALHESLEPFARERLRFLNASTSPIPLPVAEPWSVGADRIANSVAAARLYGAPILVVDFGTAINFDLVGADGAFLGGAIAPEMRLAAKALIDRAAQLHSVDLVAPDSVIGRTTETNLQAGIVLGYLDLVAGLIRRFRAECGDDLRVVATGGKGRMFYEALAEIGLYDADLTLTGLRFCWEQWSSDRRAA